MIMLLMMVASPCAADDTTTLNGETNQDFTVTYAVEPAFTIKIPSAVTLGAVDVAIPVSPISASDVLLSLGKNLTVKVFSPNGWNVHLTGIIGQPQATDKISYVMNYYDVDTKALTNTNVDDVDENVAVTVFKLPAGVESGSASLSFTRTGVAKKAGTFTDQLDFRVSVE